MDLFPSLLPPPFPLLFYFYSLFRWLFPIFPLLMFLPIFSFVDVSFSLKQHRCNPSCCNPSSTFGLSFLAVVMLSASVPLLLVGYVTNMQRLIDLISSKLDLKTFARLIIRHAPPPCFWAFLLPTAHIPSPQFFTTASFKLYGSYITVY